MPRTCRVDSSALHAVGQLGVASVADLCALGMPRSTIARRIREGRDRRLLRGIVKFGPDAPTDDQRAVAALLYGGEGAVLSGAEAARRHGLERGPVADRLLVLVPDDRQRTSSHFVTVERTQRLPTAHERGGIALAPVDRAVLDTSRSLERIDDVRALVCESVQRRFTTVARLEEELGAGNQRWSSLPRQVLGEVTAGVRSVSECWARELYASTDLPPIVWNPTLVSADGRRLGSPDGYVPSIGLAWQIDSVAFHLSVDDWDRTLRSRSRLTSEGIIVEHTRPRRIKLERDAVVAELHAAAHLAGSRPVPDIRVVPAA